VFASAANSIDNSIPLQRRRKIDSSEVIPFSNTWEFCGADNIISPMTKQKRRKTDILAYAQFVSPDFGNSTQVSRARQALISATRRLCPEFFDALSKEVLPHYKTLAMNGYGLEPSSPSRLLPDDSPLKESIYSWADRFNARTDWLIDDALNTLERWNSFPDFHESLRWFSYPVFTSLGGTGDSFQFTFACWDTEFQTWASYEKALHKHLKGELSKYRLETETLARSVGLVRSTHKYSPDNFDWFVLYQFRGLRLTDIVQMLERKIDSSTVLRGVQAAARLVGWNDLRPS
jgi:hypothetical protein